MDAAIEAAAAAEYEHLNVTELWPDADQEARADYLSDARVALTAALPHIRSAIADEIEAIARSSPAQWLGSETLLEAARVARGGPLDA